MIAGSRIKSGMTILKSGVKAEGWIPDRARDNNLESGMTDGALSPRTGCGAQLKRNTNEKSCCTV